MPASPSAALFKIDAMPKPASPASSENVPATRPNRLRATPRPPSSASSTAGAKIAITMPFIAPTSFFALVLVATSIERSASTATST